MNTIIERRESADGYSAVVARLNPRWRVIACRDGIQWILQFIKWRGGAQEWQARSFCRTRDALIRVSTGNAAPIDPSALAVLRALPARIEGGRP